MSETLTIFCTGCSAKLRLKINAPVPRGKTITCPKCQAVVEISRAAAESSAESANLPRSPAAPAGSFPVSSSPSSLKKKNQAEAATKAKVPAKPVQENKKGPVPGRRKPTRKTDRSGQSEWSEDDEEVEEGVDVIDIADVPGATVSGAPTTGTKPWTPDQAYPPEIWQEAQSRWNAMPAEQRQKLIDDVRAEIVEEDKSIQEVAPKA